MKRFSVQPSANTPSPKKKKWIAKNISEIRVILGHPHIVGFYASKKWDLNHSSYTNPLDVLLDEGDKTVATLGISFKGSRKVPGTLDSPLKNQAGYNWTIYLRQLKATEVENCFEVANSWGLSVTNCFNKYVVPNKYQRVEIFEFAGVVTTTENILDISNILIQKSAIEFVKGHYEDTMEDGSFYEDQELLKTFFPGVTDVKTFLGFYFG